MSNLIDSENKRCEHFWIFAGLIAILLISLMMFDINRPFTGLHSWGEASIAWRSKVNLKYDISYTKLLSTWAVGNPPEKVPHHYLDHPQLGMLLRTADMLIFGINETAQRAGGIIRAVVCLLLFFVILRKIADDRVALLAGLLLSLFPMTTFFGPRDWTFPLSFICFWFYLKTIGAFDEKVELKKKHYWGLALSLFFVIQMSWSGFFYAMAIGIHYVAMCMFKKVKLNIAILSILFFAPLLSTLANFTVMLAGNGWDFDKIYQLYQWRAGKGEMEAFEWGKWFARFWEFAVMNFTLAVLIVAILYLTIGQLYVFSAGADSKKQGSQKSLRFPYFWLFLMPGVFQLFLLKGTLWMHHYWERPLVPFVAIAAALGIITLFDGLAKIKPAVAKTAIVLIMAAITISAAAGLNHYHHIKHFSPAKVRLFKMLNEKIPPNESLLSFESWVVEQHKAKGAFYRPEVAWYLDRHIICVNNADDLEKHKKDGTGRYYLIPLHQQLMPFINQLAAKYQYQSIPGDPGAPGQAPMRPYMLFDLHKLK